MNITPISTRFTQNIYFQGKKQTAINGHDKNQEKDVFVKNTPRKEYKSLTEKYGLNPSEIGVKAATPFYITDKQKALFVEKLLEAHELAKKNVETGNMVKLGFSTNMCLSDDTWHLATNFNNTRNDISSICGERSAVIVAYNDFLKNLIKTGDTKLTQNDFKIKYLVMSSAKELGKDRNASSPCADCLSWLNTTKFFDDDTKIIYLTSDENTNKYSLEIKTLKELLPMRGRDALDSIPTRKNALLNTYVISKDAQRIMDEKGIDVKDIRKTLMKARDIYNTTNFTSYSDQKIGACIKTGNNYFYAPKIDWSKRWFVEPAEFAIAKSIEELDEPQMPDIIAYYGTNETIAENDEVERDGIISLKTLGRIKSYDRNAEPLIVVINGNDEIDVRSINDFMPKSSAFHQSYLK